MFTFDGIDEEDLVLFQENLQNRVLMRRAQAIVAQRKATAIARSTGGQRVTRGKHGTLITRPTANIDPLYYYSRMGQEREASAERLKTGENVWEDPEFLPWELKNNPELRPIIDDRNAPVHMGGIVMPGSREQGAGSREIVIPTSENFKAAKQAAH